MPTITSTGVGSGLDVNTIVTSLMNLEKRSLTTLQQESATLQTRLSAYGNLKGQLATLGDVATRLSTAVQWNPLRVDSANATAVSATASTAAAAGRHTVQVDQLAQAQVLTSRDFASPTAATGTGHLTLELGTTAAGVFTPGSATPVTVAVTAANSTLAGVRDAINAARAGVTASIVTGSGGSRLVLRGTDGAAQSMRITATDDDGNATDTSGLSVLAFDPSAAADAGRNLTQPQAAQDARFSVDGVAVTSTTNTSTDAIDGITLSLRQVTTSPVELSVSVETMAVRKNVNDFANAYNALNKLLQAQTLADPAGTNRGALQADSTALSLLNGLRTMLRGAVDGLPSGDPDSLSAAGLQLQRDGSLQVVEARLAPLLERPERLARLFASAQSGSNTETRGLGVRFADWAKALTADSGALAGRVDGLKGSSERNQKRQHVEQARLARTEARLRAQYQQLDTQMSTLGARMQQMRASLGLG